LSNARAWIGTSGWNYSHWRGIYYPEGLRSADWLACPARHFETVELNTSFYRIPAAHLLHEWQARTLSSIRFATKVWRAITHYNDVNGHAVENARHLAAELE
jgi:uncharacterized protein YecE (DUF72 family)